MSLMNNDPPVLGDVIAVLERTPATMAALLDGLPEVWATATEGAGTWSPLDVVGHLIHGERSDWIPRARHILAGDPRPLAAFDREAQFKESSGQTMSARLATFERQRRENLATLKAFGLTSEDLSRRGLHPELGEVTLGQLLATWVVHDLDHVGQVARTMAKVYGTTVGPWSAYLSILSDRPRP